MLEDNIQVAVLFACFIVWLDSQRAAWDEATDWNGSWKCTSASVIAAHCKAFLAPPVMIICGPFLGADVGRVLPVWSLVLFSCTYQ
jgi:hypothetical protein